MDPHKPEADSPGYEVTDVNVNGIVVFLASLARFCRGLLHFLFRHGQGHQHRHPEERWAAKQMESDRRSAQWQASGSDIECGDGAATSSIRWCSVFLRLACRSTTATRTLRKCMRGKICCSTTTAGLIARAVRCASRSPARWRSLLRAVSRSLPRSKREPLMAGDKAPVVTVPLTDGFARTGYEQQYLETLEQQRMRGEKPGEQAALGAGR